MKRWLAVLSAAALIGLAPGLGLYELSAAVQGVVEVPLQAAPRVSVSAPVFEAPRPSLGLSDASRLAVSAALNSNYGASSLQTGAGAVFAHALSAQAAVPAAAIAVPVLPASQIPGQFRPPDALGGGNSGQNQSALSQAAGLGEQGGSGSPASGRALEAQGSSLRHFYDGGGAVALTPAVSMRRDLPNGSPRAEAAGEPEAHWSVRLTTEFRDSVNRLARTRLDRKRNVWGPEQRLLLVEHIRRAIDGERNLLVPSRGRAGEASVKKFKWNGQGFRIFVHVDEERRVLTLLDVRLKSHDLSHSPLPQLEIMREGSEGQSAFYEELADRVAEGIERRLVKGIHGETGAIWTALRRLLGKDDP